MDLLKKVALIVVIIAGLGVIYMAGFSTGGASSSWTNEMQSQASREIGAVGYQTKETLLGDNNQNVKEDAKEVVLPEIEAAKLELERMLEEYYRMRVEGLTETEAYKTLVQQIEAQKNAIFNRYKSEIDSVFDSL